MEQTKAVSQEKKATEVEGADEELNSLLEQSKTLQEHEEAGDPVKADYILLAKSGSKALKRSMKDLFIEGLAIGDFYIQKEKKNLGNALKVVPLSFITVYSETDGAQLNAKFFGMWNKEQACQFPVADGSYFDRQLPNGHILSPSNWVMVEVLDHPEIENAVIAYKRTGARIWKAWKEDAKVRSGSSATLVYDIFEDNYSNDKNEWTDINFKFTGSLLESDKKMALKCLRKSNSIREAYEKHFLVGNHDVKSITASPAVKALVDATEVEDAGSGEEEELGF